MSPFYTPPNPAIVRELGADERIVWSEQPDPSRTWSRELRETLVLIPVEVFAAVLGMAIILIAHSLLASGRAPTSFSALPPALLGFTINGVIYAAI